MSPVQPAELEPLVIVGAGGFGREVLDVMEAINAERPTYGLLGFVDDAITDVNLERITARGATHLGGVADHLAGPHSRVSYVIGIGGPGTRRSLAARFDAAGAGAATLVHPASTQGSAVSIGAGSVICAGVRLTTNIDIGRHAHINLNATVGHDTTIGEFVSLNPLASISGDCCLEDGVLVGVAGVVLNGLRVGAGATVGGSACAVRDVPPATTVVGVPAKPLPVR